MAKVEKILFALELADISERIVPWVELVTNQFNAELHLLHVVPDLNFFAYPYAVDTKPDRDAMKASAEKTLGQFEKDHLGNISATHHVACGDTVEEILSTIESENISLVILGTHGRKGLDRAIFGSVTDRVLRAATVPVLCVPGVA
jgi:nucleotide-binding universal stress UspA family protein